jgi:hypothetical protein
LLFEFVCFTQVKSQGNSIQYHGQIDRCKGEVLYHLFVDSISAAVFEVQCASKQEELPVWYVTWARKRLQADTAASQTVAFDPSLPPTQVFRQYPATYSSFDEETGLPLTNADGQALTKSALKKLRKLQEAHVKRHDKWKENKKQQLADKQDTTQAAGATTKVQNNDYANKEDEITAADWKTILDPSLCTVVAGSFAMRQGLELQSDMGPFCHVLQI